MKEIDEFLRENKPIVKDDPTFLMETHRRMREVEGIKSEVDRQRRNGRKALIITLAAGLALGVLLTVLAFLCPVDVQAVGDGAWEGFRAFIDAHKQYLIYPVAALAVALSLVLTLGNKKTAQL